MSIQSELQDLQANVVAIDSAIIDKGGTVSGGGLSGTPDDILSIPTGGDAGTGYGFLTLKDYQVNYSLSNTGCTASIVDETAFKALLTNLFGKEALRNNNVLWLYFRQYADGNFSDVRANIQYGGENSFPMEDLDGIINITSQSSTGVQMTVQVDISITTSEQTTTFDLTKAEFDGLVADTSQGGEMEEGGSGPFPVVQGVIYPPEAISGFEFGEKNTYIPDYFLSGTPINTSITIPGSIHKVGDYFLSNCSSFNSTVTIGEGVVEIGQFFLYSCQAFNKTVTLPNSLNKIGRGFMQQCTSFDQPMTVNAKEIGSYFMYFCTNFNSSVTFTNKVEKLGEYFGYSWQKFNQPIMIPTTIDTLDGFLCNCNLFNQPITIPSNIKYIQNGFLDQCPRFNQDITIPGTVVTIIGSILSVASDMVHTVTVETLPPTPSTNNTSLSAINRSVASATTGISITGSYADDWITALPDKSAQYGWNRHLIKV